MTRPRYSSATRGALNRFPKPERPVLDRIISQVKHEVHATTDETWWKAAVATYGQLQKHRRQVRAAGS